MSPLYSINLIMAIVNLLWKVIFIKCCLNLYQFKVFTNICSIKCVQWILPVRRNARRPCPWYRPHLVSHISSTGRGKSTKESLSNWKLSWMAAPYQPLNGNFDFLTVSALIKDQRQSLHILSISLQFEQTLSDILRYWRLSYYKHPLATVATRIIAYC